MAAHKHAEVIKAYADGAEVEYYDPSREKWMECPHPAFYPQDEYRIKPAKPERVYPVTRMTGEEMSKFWDAEAGLTGMAAIYKAHDNLANVALRHAIDAGQVVTREEFDRMCAEHSKALGDVRRRLHNALCSNSARGWQP